MTDRSAPGGRGRQVSSPRPSAVRGQWPDRYQIVEDRRPVFLRARDRKMGRDVIIRSRGRAHVRDGAHGRDGDVGGPRREAWVLERAARNNPNVPRVLDRWLDGDQEHFVLDYVAGTPLDSLIAEGRGRGKPYFSPAAAHRMVWGLIKGLSALHRHGICHGDLKPANLIVGRNNRLVMIDFGSAWSGGVPRGGRDRGTPGYSSPEQWREEKLVDGRADQFSVSVILYELLTNELPWDGLGGSVVTHLSGAIPAPLVPSQHAVVRERAVPLWPALDRVVMRGLQIDKDARFETTQAWLRAFEGAGPQLAQDKSRRDDLVRGAVRQWFARLWRKVQVRSPDKPVRGGRS